jgi:hypothetical protein
MKTFFFTFGGFNQPKFHNTCAMIIAPDSAQARDLMCQHFGAEWAFQYDSLENVHALDRKISAVIVSHNAVFPEFERQPHVDIYFNGEKINKSKWTKE